MPKRVVLATNNNECEKKGQKIHGVVTVTIIIAYSILFRVTFVNFAFPIDPFQAMLP